MKINFKQKGIWGIWLGIFLFYFCLILYNIGIDIVVNYTTNENGSIQIFTTSDDSQEYSENNSFNKEIDHSTDQVVVSTKNKKIESLRFDFDNISNININKVSFKIGSINLISLTPEDILNRIKFVNTVEINADSSALSITSIGTDSYFSFDVTTIKVPFMVYILFITIAIISYLILIKIVSLYLRLPICKREIINRYTIALILVVVALIANIYTLNRINKKNYAFYSIKTYESSNDIVKKDKLSTEFEAVTNHLNSMNIPLFERVIPNGSLHYQIKNSNGNIIFENTIHDFKNMINENAELCLDVSALQFECGKTYLLELDFLLENEIMLQNNTDHSLRLKQVYDFKYKPLMISVLILLDAIGIGFILFVRKKGFNNQCIMLLSLVIGILCSFIMTPCNMDDEYRHFLRAYDISQGNMRVGLSEYSEDITGNVSVLEDGQVTISEVPYSINQLKYVDEDYNFNEKSYYAEMNYDTNIDRIIEISKRSDSQKYKVSLAATWSISCLSYLPQVILLLFGRLLHLNGVWLYYLARIGNVIFCSLILYFSLMLVPKYKNQICLVHFMPALVLLRSSCSSDGFLNSIILFTVCLILYAKENQIKIMNYKYLLILTVCTSYVAIMKLPYMVIVLLLLLLDETNYTKLTRCKSKIVSLLLSFGVMAVSLFAYKSLSSFMQAKAVMKDIPTVQTNALVSNEHIDYILQHSSTFTSMMIHEIVLRYDRYFGAITGSYSQIYGKIYIIGFFVILVLSAKKFKLIEKMYIFLLFLGIIFTILLVGFTWQIPTYGSVWGVGSRYFVQIMLLIALVLPIGTNKSEDMMEKIVQLFLISGNIGYMVLLMSVYLL
ncbi:MAG: DUF2142 domain-containing protein [Lachnospiraceae bacterium]|nr:DUF2142 domain-containing protein [Lachnospiraceae bacterium]